MKKTMLAVILTGLALCSHAQQSLDSALSTVGGKVRVASKDGISKELMIGKKAISQVPSNDHLHIKKKFSIDGKDVLLVSNQCAGSSCSWVSWNFVTIAPGGKVLVSQEMTGSDGEEPKINLDKDTITITLTEIDGHRKKTTSWIYENGNVKKI